MKKLTKNYATNDTTKIYDNINTFLYLFGLRYFWVNDVRLPTKFVKVFDALYPSMYALQCIFCLLQFTAVFVQKYLTDKQQNEAMVFGICQPVIHLFCWNCISHRKRCRQVLYYLAMDLKEVHNDKQTEQLMIKKLKLYLIMYGTSIFMCWAYCGFEALVDVVKSGALFTGIITAWPDVTDVSTIATCARVILYLLWCFSFYRMSTAFIIVLVLFISMSYQYINLQKYFESLNDIFEEIGLCHKEKEVKFEAALVKGIQAHNKTLWCMQESQKICNGISSLIVFFGPTMTPILLNCKNFDDFCNHVSTLVASVIVLALFMWNAGDVTVEAQKVSDAIFNCGWYNCYGKQSTRIRSLVVVAMMQAQKPVAFTAFGIVNLSYDTFVTIIKTAYSMVSVLY